jgi:hypothetical protein
VKRPFGDRRYPPRGHVDLRGATNSTLMLTGVGTNNAGNYTVTVSNPFGSKTQLIARILVTQPSLTFERSLINGRFRIWLPNDTDHFDLEASTDLKTWTLLETYPSNNPNRFRDYSITNPPFSFFRARPR